MQANTDPRYPQPTQFIVDTADGRHMQWPAYDYDDLLRTLHFYGHTPKKILPLSEYEAETAAKEAQEDLIYQWQLELERELKESA
ncbi:hypothetical protein BSK62_13330 [Paenibacillus odorifer]|uniref:hypothetical protein n=1 Tax=Paenibacillus odorifer TaxID=189426 RepID=UPI00096FD083|nr:hypothetical protein [Paenibacillus odorifer]OMD66044.1 hypothetical protein BSK62_13330 [Paenibacillus odorifer]